MNLAFTFISAGACWFSSALNFSEGFSHAGWFNSLFLKHGMKVVQAFEENGFSFTKTKFLYL
jgi:hypothetical protein